MQRRKRGTVITPEKAEIILRDWKTASNVELAERLGIGRKHISHFLHRRGLFRASYKRKASYGTTQGELCIRCGSTERYVRTGRCATCARKTQSKYRLAVIMHEQQREIEARSQSESIKTLLYRRWP